MIKTNSQRIQPVGVTEFLRKVFWEFDPGVMSEAEAALKRWLKI